MRYKQLAETFIDAIQQGDLKPGQRMPSLRQVALQHQVSMTTAMNCYRQLEQQQWINARPQSGFFVDRPTTLESATLDFPQFTSQITQPYSPGAIEPGPLSLSLVAPQLMPTRQLQQSARRAMKQLGSQVHLYPEIQGSLALRAALSEHFARYHFPFQAGQLVISNGCLDAVRTALEVCSKPGDAVAINSPCFSGLLNLLSVMNRSVVEIPSTAQGLDLDQLEQLIQQGTVQAGLFSTTHINPQGLTLTVEQKQRLAKIANQYQFPIIEDDVYFELSHSSSQPLPAKYWDKHGDIIWCSSVSKTLSAGYRLGWCLPGRFFNDFLQQRVLNSHGVNTPAQMTVADLIGSGQYLKHLRQIRSQLSVHAIGYQQYLKQKLPKNTQMSHVSGGMVLWLQIPGLNTDQLAITAKAKGIEFVPGSSFTTLALYHDCLRINMGWPIESTVGSELSAQSSDHLPARQQLDQLIELIQQQLNKICQ